MNTTFNNATDCTPTGELVTIAEIMEASLAIRKHLSDVRKDIDENLPVALHDEAYKMAGVDVKVPLPMPMTNSMYGRHGSWGGSVLIHPNKCVVKMDIV